MPTFDFSEKVISREAIFPSKEELMQLERSIKDKISVTNDVIEKEFYLKWLNVSEQIKPATSAAETGPCLIPWFSSYIRANGDVVPCCYIRDRDFTLGNIFQTDFLSIWNSETYRNFRETLVKNRSKIKDCFQCPRNDTSRLKRLKWLF